MFKLLNLQTIKDDRGILTVIDKVLPFPIARVFYIYKVNNSERGGHRHIKTRQAAICITGRCDIHMDNGIYKENFILDSPDKCIIIEPEDWHTMSNFTPDAILLVFASEPFKKEDYIYEKY